MSVSELLARGQAQIDGGHYEEAIATFTSVIEAAPREIDAYRGRSEANLMLDRYSEAYKDLYARLIAAVEPADVDLADTILKGYKKRLSGRQRSAAALSGASFARWVYWQYGDAIPLLDELLAMSPNNAYATLFRGSNRLFVGRDVEGGKADIERAIQLSPGNAQLRHIVADAYTYTDGRDIERASREASLALQLGLDTPRIHAILAAALLERGDLSGAAVHFQRHIDLVTKENVHAAPLAAKSSATFDLVPGRTIQIPLDGKAGEHLKIETSLTCKQVADTILVLLGPEGAPVMGNDDFVKFFAGLDWPAPATGTYLLRVTSFESISTGPLVVTRG